MMTGFMGISFSYISDIFIDDICVHGGCGIYQDEDK